VQSSSIFKGLKFLPAIALTWLLLSSKWNVSASVKIEISAKYEVTLNQADFPILPSTAGLIPLPVPNQAEFQVPCRFTNDRKINKTKPRQTKNSMPPTRIFHAARRPMCLKKRMEYARWRCLHLKLLAA
jgi:hypothetical protein